MEGSIAAFSKAIFFVPQDAAYWAHRAEAYIALGDFKSALLNYRKAVRLDPDVYDYKQRLACVHYLMGELQQEAGCMEEAIRCFSEASHVDPFNADYRMHRVRTYIHAREYQKALQELNPVLDHPPPSVHALLEDSESSRKAVATVVPFTVDKRPPSQPSSLSSEQEKYLQALATRAKVLLLMLKPEEAHSDVLLLRRLCPHHPSTMELQDTLAKKAEALYNTATAHLLCSNAENALVDLYAAIQMQPEETKLYQLRARVYRSVGEHERALADLKTALALLVRARKQSIGTFAATEEELQKTSDFVFDGVSSLGRDLLRVVREEAGAGQHPHGLPVDSAEVIRLDVEKELALTFGDLGLAYYRDSHFIEAISCLSRAIELNPQHPVFFIHRGDCHRMLEEDAQAMADYKHVLSLAPGDAQHERAVALRCSVIHNERGRRLYNTGDYEGADVEFTKAIFAAEGVGAYHFHRGQAREQLKRLSLAHKDYQEAVELDHSNEEARRKLEALELTILQPAERTSATVTLPRLAAPTTTGRERMRPQDRRVRMEQYARTQDRTRLTGYD